MDTNLNLTKETDVLSANTATDISSNKDLAVISEEKPQNEEVPPLYDGEKLDCVVSILGVITEAIDVLMCIFD